MQILSPNYWSRPNCAATAVTASRALRNIYSLLTEILGGLLSGNGLGKQWWKNGGHGINGVFLQALAVEEFQSLDSFYDKVDELIAFIKSSQCAPGFSEILLPGESDRRREAVQLKSGIELDDETWSELTELAAELGVTEVPRTI